MIDFDDRSIFKVDENNFIKAIEFLFSKKPIKKIIPENKIQKIIMFGKNSILKDPLFLQ